MKRYGRITISLMSALAVAGGVFCLGASPASAAPAATPVNCPGSTLCTYENANYNNSGASGTQWNFAFNSSPHLVWFYVGNAANDKISSLYNNRAWVSYVNKDCPARTNTYAFAGGARPADFSSWSWPDGSGMNDTISSIAMGTSTTTQTLTHGQC
ncbi:MAG TPA: peptidase inhibitor family I36 protein [Rugosimonospora sp.]|nr:peptidase inhibitor family I36 protein [Rugosimonospora sp.]